MTDNSGEVARTGTTASTETTANGPREVELKYLVRDLEALRSWLARGWGGALDGVEAGDERTVEVEERYVDTAYGALAQAGFAARLRREDGGSVSVTVKSTSRDRPATGDAPSDEDDSFALSQRVEVEGPAGNDWTPTSGRPVQPGSSSTRCATALDCAPSSPSTSAASGAPWPSTTDRCW